MSKKLDKILDKLLMEQPEGILPSIPDFDTGYDISKESERNMRKDVLSPSYTQHPAMDADAEPADKVMIQIIDYFMRGEFSKANLLIKSCRDLRNGTFFSWWHMNQLLDWVRNIHKFTNMGNPNDLSRNYYQYQMDKDQEMLGVSDLRKVPVGEVMIDKFVKDVENVFRRGVHESLEEGAKVFARNNKMKIREFCNANKVNPKTCSKYEAQWDKMVEKYGEASSGKFLTWFDALKNKILRSAKK